MVEKSNELIAFSLRLKEALKDNELDAHGSGVTLAEELKRKGAKCSPQAVNKWVNGASMPHKENMRILSERLKVRQAWLQYGEEPKKQPDSFQVQEQPAQYSGTKGISIDKLSRDQQEALIQLRMAFMWGYMTDEDARSLLEEINRKRIEKGIGRALI